VSEVGVIIVGNQLPLLLFRGIIGYSSSGLGMLFVTAELDYSRCSIIGRQSASSRNPGEASSLVTAVA